MKLLIVVTLLLLSSCADVSVEDGGDAGATCQGSVVDWSIFYDERGLLTHDCLGEDYHRLQIFGSCAEWTCEWTCASFLGEECSFVSLTWSRCGWGDWSEPEVFTAECAL